MKRYMGGIMWAADEASTYGRFVGYRPVCRTCEFNDDAMYIVNAPSYYNQGVNNNLDGTYGTPNPALKITPVLQYRFVVI